MMIEPSIDKLLSKTKNNKYVLCTIITKRAKEIESVRRLELADQDKKAISIAKIKQIKNNNSIHFPLLFFYLCILSNNLFLNNIFFKLYTN